MKLFQVKLDDGRSLFAVAETYREAISALTQQKRVSEPTIASLCILAEPQQLIICEEHNTE